MQPIRSTPESAGTPLTVATPTSLRDQAASASPRHRGLKASTAALTLAMIAGGCGGHGSKVTLPSTPPPAAPSAASSSSSASASPATPKDAVIAAYTGFFPAINNALKAPPERIRPILQDFLTGWYLDYQIRQLVDQQAQHLEPWGHVVVHITNVEVQQSTATVRDCQDASNAGLANAQTHQLITASRGTAHRNLTAKLTLGSDGRWRLSELRQFKTACRAS
jgi:hypothetical protein